ncbi:hypothetical protein [Mycolicibacterium goodii]|uniref:Membrane protein n=1 Tax=Mycolicibacterium goodii TaxID=134601 RepID=A0A0K0X133_MYCGD|nr:membrane protein [Mycolicibacterium goodii]
MGRTVAVTWHVVSTLIAAGLFFFFVIPRWPELMGETSPTLGTVLRIVTGVLVGLTALPVVLTWQRTRRPELGTPELALRLRTTSILFHVIAGVLIAGTAVAEIWISLDSAGSWLFGIYGAAAALALLGVFGFYLAFIAELPPPPPKPLKPKVNARRKIRAADKTGETAGETTDEKSEGSEESEATAESAESEEPAGDTEDGGDTESGEETSEESADDATEDSTDQDSTDEDESGGKLRNKRPSTKANKAGKGGSSRFRRRSRGGIATEE